MKEKNKEIEFWRFIFTVLICAYHFNNFYFGGVSYFKGGYIAVEFFFILSGFLMMFSVNKDNALKYSLKRAIRLYPHYIFSLIITFSFLMISSKTSLIVICKNIFNSIYTILMLHILSIDCKIYNPQTWYISAMLIGGYFIYYMIRNYKKIFINLIAPFMIIFIYSYYSVNIHHLGEWNISILFFRVGLLRAVAGMSLGCICYEIYNKLRKYSVNKVVNNLLCVCEILIFSFVILCSINVAQKQSDFVLVIFLAVSMVISFYHRGITKKILDNKMISFLGEISYAMYLNHLFIREIFLKYLPNKGTSMFLVFIIVTIIYSILTNELVKHLTNLIRNTWNKYKGSILIKEDNQYIETTNKI